MEIAAAFAASRGWYRSDRYKVVRSSEEIPYIALDERGQGYTHYSPFQGFSSDDPRAPTLPGFRSDRGEPDLLNDFFTMARKHQEAMAVYRSTRDTRFDELGRTAGPAERWNDFFKGEDLLVKKAWRTAIQKCEQPTLDFVSRWGFLGLFFLCIEGIADEPDIEKASQRWVQSNGSLVAPGIRVKLREGHCLDRRFNPGWVPYDDAMAYFFPFGILPPEEVVGAPSSPKHPLLAPRYCERISAIVDISTSILSSIEKLEIALHPEKEIKRWQLEPALKNLNVEAKIGLFVDEFGSPGMDFAYLTLFDAVKLMFIISRSSKDRDIQRCKHCERLFPVSARSRAEYCTKSCQTSAKQARYRERLASEANKSAPSGS